MGLACALALGCSKKSNNNAGAAGTGGAATGTGGAATGTGGTGTGGAMLACPTATVTSCGGVACPAVSAALAQACTQTCCTAAGQCGTHNALLDTANAQCAVTPQNTTMCPDETITGTAVPGCCTSDGITCGVVDILTGSNTCVARNSPALALLGASLAPKNCDGSTPATGTAGTGTGGMGTGGMGTGGTGTGGTGTGGMGTGGTGTGGTGTGGTGTGGTGTGGMGTGGH
jgi:hypothetical protein